MNSSVFFQPETAQQVAALPFVVIDGEVAVLLVTSRRRHRWIVPKGWPSKRMSLSACAAREAEEEAGVVGLVQTSPIGSYRYIKDLPESCGAHCLVLVYPLLVLEQRMEWREQGERRLQWGSLAEAAELIGDRNLAELFQGLVANDGAPLHAFIEAVGEVSGGGRAIAR